MLESDRALVMLELGHTPVYYLSREDLRMERLERMEEELRVTRQWAESHISVKDGEIAGIRSRLEFVEKLLGIPH